MRDTQEEKFTSDMVAKMLYLAYFNESQQANIKFKELKKLIKDKKTPDQDKETATHRDEFGSSPIAIENDNEEEGKRDNEI